MQKLHLTIPEPCHENWQHMTPTQQGRFCNACAKEVVDFSTMTDIQVLNYFTTLTHEKVCGRALPEQLNRPISRLAKPKQRLFWYWNYIVMFFMFFSKGNAAKAQGNVKPVTEINKVKANDEVVTVAGYTVRRTDQKERQTSPAVSKLGEDKVNRGGRVSVVVNKELLYIINREMSTKKIVANLNPDDIDEYIDLKPAKATALFGIDGANGAIIITTRKSKEIKLKEVIVASDYGVKKVAGMLGMMSFTPGDVIIKKKDSVIKSDDQLKVYPNPVQRGEQLNISLKLKQTGLHQIQVTDATGRIVLQKQINAISKEVTEKILTDNRWSSGIYYINIFDNKNKLVNKTRFIVQ